MRATSEHTHRGSKARTSARARRTVEDIVTGTERLRLDARLVENTIKGDLDHTQVTHRTAVFLARLQAERCRRTTREG
jgi:hypothetical protein